MKIFIIILLIFSILVILGSIQERKTKKLKKHARLKEISDAIRISLKENKQQTYNARDLSIEYDITKEEAEALLKEASEKYYGQIDVDEKGIVFVRFEK